MCLRLHAACTVTALPEGPPCLGVKNNIPSRYSQNLNNAELQVFTRISLKGKFILMNECFPLLLLGLFGSTNVSGSNIT